MQESSGSNPGWLTRGGKMRYLLSVIIILVSACNVLQCNYITAHGIKVFHGELNSPQKDEVENWTDDTINFWVNQYVLWQDCVGSSIKDSKAFFADELYFIINETKVAGFTTYKQMFMARQKDLITSRILFIHELSHTVTWFCGGFWDQAESHMLFKEKGLYSI